MDSRDLEHLFVTQWAQCVERSKRSLEPNDLDDLHRFVSWDSVRKALLEPPTEPTSDFATAKPALGHLHSFTLIFETKLGTPLDADFLWGILGILLQVASAQDATRATLRILRSIGYKADTFNTCHAAFPSMLNQLKEACFDIQLELVEFCIDAIKCLRRDDELVNRDTTHQEPVRQMEQRYLSVNSELDKTLAQVEKLVQFKGLTLAIHNRADKSQATTTLPKKPTTLLLPNTRTLRFFDRVDIFALLDSALGDSPRTAFRSVALWGLGGIGKSSIALRYVESMVGKGKYDSMLWVHAEKRTDMQRSFTEIAIKLKLPGAKPDAQFHDDNLELVHEWLQSTDSAWLLIYDNVSTSDTLVNFWPVSNRGHIIITTRSSSVAFHQATSGIEVTSWDIKMGSDFLMFLLQKEIGKDLEKEGLSANELSRRLSGHALGISHVAGLIRRRSFTIAEFMNIYLNNPRRVHGSELERLWDFSFRSLDDLTRNFLGAISFLMPDDIPQSLFERNERLPGRLDFCSDKFSFSEIIEGLLEVSLIKRNRDTRAFSIHRMVQTQFKYFMKPPQLQSSFEDAVMLVYSQFPRMGDEKGQLYDEWSRCNALLQQVISLKDNFRECSSSNKNFKAPWEFCDLLRECQRYLYESNAFEDLEDMCNVNLDAIKTLESKQKVNELLPHIYSHQANMYEGLGAVQKAIDLNKKGYSIRLNDEPINQVLCYGFEANLGYTHNTANDHDAALEWFEKARTRWRRLVEKGSPEDSYPTVLKKNMARCFVHLGRLEDARSLLDAAIAEFKTAKPFNWGMLAYAYQVSGLINRLERKLEAAEADFLEAENTWRRGDQSRLNPFFGGCAYKTGAVCLDQGKTEAAVKHLRDSFDVTKFHKDTMPVEHARTCFKLSEALLQDNPDDATEAEELREDAEVYLKRRDPDASDFSSEASYDKFVPIFWR